MKKTMIFMLFSGLVLVLTGCGKSAQEKVADEQLKVIEQQKAMVAGFEKAAEEFRAKGIPPVEYEKPRKR